MMLGATSYMKPVKLLKNRLELSTGDHKGQYCSNKDILSAVGDTDAHKGRPYYTLLRSAHVILHRYIVGTPLVGVRDEERNVRCDYLYTALLI